MRVLSVIVDKMPENCLLGCPLIGRMIPEEGCGQQAKKELAGGWTGYVKVPDERCKCKVE